METIPPPRMATASLKIVRMGVMIAMANSRGRPR
jgi:hypothetical protein